MKSTTKYEIVKLHVNGIKRCIKCAQSSTILLSFHEVVIVVIPEQRLVIAPIKFKVKSFRNEIKLEPHPDWSLLYRFNSNHGRQQIDN